MKIVSKKLLSVLLAVCLLASIALPAGILSASADPATDADVVVNKVNLSKWSAATYSATSGISFNTSTSGLFSYAEEYSKIPANAEATIEFDYYLNGGTGLNVNSSKNARLTNVLTDSFVLDEGYGSFKSDAKSYDSEWYWTIVPVKSINSGNVKQPDLYIWNLKVSYGETVKTTPTTAAVNTACQLCANDSLTAEQALEITNLAAVKAAFPADSVFMTEIDFTANPASEKESDYYRARLHSTYIWTASKNYTLTFDYYLPETGTKTFLTGGTFNSDAQIKDADGNVIYLQPGRNTYKATGIKITTGRNGYFDFVQLGTAKFSKLYVWNVQLLPDDGASDTTSKKTNLMVGDFWEAIKVPGSDPAEIKTTVNTSRVVKDDLPGGPTVVNKINLSKWSAATYSATSGISFNSSTSGLFSYAEEYSKIPANTDATISFDYYLNGGTGLNVNCSNNSRIANVLTDSFVLDEGYGSFNSGVVNKTADWYWTIVPVKSKNYSVKQPDLYIWNLKVTYGETVKTTPKTAAVNTACALCADDSLTAEQALEITDLDTVKAAFPEDSVFMTEIDFTANPASEKESDYYRANLHQTYIWTASKNYTLTFDYYLSETGTKTFLTGGSFNSDAQIKDADGNVIYLQPGRNTYKATGIKITTGRNGYFSFVQLGTAKFSKLYVWNVQLLPDDGASDTTSKKTNLMVGDFWEAMKVPGSDPAEIKTTINTSRVATADLPSAPVTTATSATETTATSATETTATQAQPTIPTKPAADMVWTIVFGKANETNNHVHRSDTYQTWALGDLSLDGLYEISPDDNIKDFWYADYAAKTKSDTLNGKFDQQEFSYSFDYYSPVENTIVMTWNNSSVANLWCNHENYRKLEEGFGHMEAGGTIHNANGVNASTKTYPILKISDSQMIEDTYTLYIWNLKIMLNGVEVTSKIARDDMYYNRAHDNAELKPLSSFDWYTPPTTATTAGSTTATTAPAAGTTATQAPAGNTTATQAPAAGTTTATTAAATTPTQAPDAGDKGDEFVGVYDKDNDVAVEYEDGEAFPEDAYLSVYPFAEEEMKEDYEDILNKIGDFDYKAFDIAVFVGEDVVDLDGAVEMKLPVPEGFDADAVKVYMTDAYGDLFLVEAEVVDGYLVFTTDVLGVCVIVNGDLGIAAQPDADAPEADDKEETDSPETGDNVVGIVIAALALVAAAAAAIVSKKRTA